MLANCGPGAVVEDSESLWSGYFIPDPSSKKFCTIGGNIAQARASLREIWGYQRLRPRPGIPRYGRVRALAGRLVNLPPVTTCGTFGWKRGTGVVTEANLEADSPTRGRTFSPPFPAKPRPVGARAN